jgi:hypothetical protein
MVVHGKIKCFVGQFPSKYSDHVLPLRKNSLHYLLNVEFSLPNTDLLLQQKKLETTKICYLVGR